MVRTQPVQARLHRLDKVLTVVPGRVHIARAGGAGVLGGKDETLPPAAQQLPENRFRAAAGVVVGGIEEIAARFRIDIEETGAGVLVGTPAAFLVPAEGHRPQAQLADAEAGFTEQCVAHGGSSGSVRAVERPPVRR